MSENHDIVDDYYYCKDLRRHVEDLHHPYYKALVHIALGLGTLLLMMTTKEKEASVEQAAKKKRKKMKHYSHYAAVLDPKAN